MANNKSKALVKAQPRLPKPKEDRQAGDVLAYSLNRFKGFLQYVEPATDFALIPNAGKYQVEPTRNLILKIITFFELSYKVQPLNTKDTTVLIAKKAKGGKVQKEKVPTTIYTMEARVWDKFGNEVTEIGMANTLDGHTEGREDHDAQAKAGTRALKRGVEGLVGLAIINQIILRLFGGFLIGPAKVKEMKLA